MTCGGGDVGVVAVVALLNHIGQHHTQSRSHFLSSCYHFHPPRTFVVVVVGAVLGPRPVLVHDAQVPALLPPGHACIWYCSKACAPNLHICMSIHVHRICALDMTCTTCRLPIENRPNHDDYEGVPLARWMTAIAATTPPSGRLSLNTPPPHIYIPPPQLPQLSRTTATTTTITTNITH